MPARDKSFIATEIRRSLEEGNTWSFENVPQASASNTNTAENVPDSWEDDDNVHQRDNQEPGAASDQEPGSEHSSGSWQQVPEIVEDDSDQALEGEHVHDKGKAKATDTSTGNVLQESTSPAESSATNLDNAITVDTTIEVDNSSSQPEQDPSTHQDQTDS